MKFIADFHIHSKYSRATSRNMVLEEIDAWADDKGILVMGTGDFTHPLWFKEIKEKLEPAEPGLFKLKPQYKKPTIKGTKAETRFILTVEISSIFSRPSISLGMNKTYRVHTMIFAPDIKTVETINTQLSWIGNIASDGRPILGLDTKELAKIVLNINPQAVIIPAHAWTPWFSIFGSMSGFNSIEECFGEYAKDIFAIETGLSSDPPMNWRLSKLDNIALISNSDSHSLERIGREANVFDTDLSYDGIIAAIKDSIYSRNRSGITRIATLKNAEIIGVNQRTHQRQSASKFLGTIEFFPEEGKYHFDGHRLCNIVFSPQETKAHNNLCPKCGKPLTIGVMNRVEQLADRPEGFILEKAPGYKRLVQLDKIIAEAFGQNTGTKKVKEEYKKLIMKFGNEIKILTDITAEELQKEQIPSLIIEGIKRAREGKLTIRPGFDGEYGKVSIFGDQPENSKKADLPLTPPNEKQVTLF